MPIRPLLLFCRCRERQGGKEHPVFLPDVPVVPSTKLSHLRFPLLFPLPPVPELPLRRLTLHVVFNFCSRHYLPNIRRGKEI